MISPKCLFWRQGYSLPSPKNLQKVLLQSFKSLLLLYYYSTMLFWEPLAFANRMRSIQYDLIPNHIQRNV